MPIAPRSLVRLLTLLASALLGAQAQPLPSPLEIQFRSVALP
jgi:hypothetical protein